ncbi:MAG TPA: UDP-glucuronic acid decarboxylase family protein [Candidatus Sulfotelmatobacter sp.]|nr:UDP-glucuronic acid decarboxylase family protein [Candidatus Sulfotelmatobacter sp.]
MNRVLVAGGAGFIGSHLCERLLERGAAVTCLDNLATSSYANIAHLAGHPRFSFHRADITADSPPREPVAAVFHLATPASPMDYARIPLETLHACTTGTENLLELSRLTGARFVLASTSEIYGDPEVHPQPETYRGNVNCLGPRATYDEGKRVSETLVSTYRRLHSVNTAIVRIFNTYGPRMRRDDGRAVPAFIGQALAGEPLTLFGDGSQTRSLCYVDDLVDALLRMLDSGAAGPINLGNPREMTVAELAAMVIGLCESSSPITHQPLPQDDPRRRCPDITRAREELDWEPLTPLEEGLRRTIAWWRGATAGETAAQS